MAGVQKYIRTKMAVLYPLFRKQMPQHNTTNAKPHGEDFVRLTFPIIEVSPASDMDLSQA